jgi:ADP-heptose:LPS heptosyltransferase
VKSVLVVVTRQIGDVLLTTPLIRRARQLWPDAAPASCPLPVPATGGSAACSNTR